MLSCISYLLPAQSIREQKTDSVCTLVKKYLNEKNPEKLYALTGGSFRNLISDSAFNAFCNHHLFPLGRVRGIRLEKYANGIPKRAL